MLSPGLEEMWREEWTEEVFTKKILLGKEMVFTQKNLGKKVSEKNI